MKDIESERLERERSLQEKRENLQSIQFQLNTTNNHKNQVEHNVTRSTDLLYQLRYETCLGPEVWFSLRSSVRDRDCFDSELDQVFYICLIFLETM